MKNSKKIKPRLIVINQEASSFFVQWLMDLSKTYGPIELWCGNSPTVPDSMIRVRKASAYKRKTKLARFRTWLYFSLTVSWWLLHRDRYTPILVVTNPPIMPLLASILSQIQGRRFAILEWDIYPQILSAMRYLGERNPVYFLWYRLHSRALRRAALVITIGDYMGMILKAMAGSTDTNIQVIPNWVDSKNIVPVPGSDNPFAKNLGLREELVILYSGNFGETHPIETVLSVAKKLSNRMDIHFLMIGDGSKRLIIEKALEGNNLPNLNLLPSQPIDRLRNSLSTADISIVSLGREYAGLSMPSKIYSMLAAGTAILGISQPPNDLWKTIDDHKCGKNFTQDSYVEIADWISLMNEDSDQLKKYKYAARKAAEEFYDKDRIWRQLDNAIFSNLLS